MLDPGARARLAGTRFADVSWLAEAVSTNDEVASRVRAGATDGVVVVAEHQTAGRGRRGRRWKAPPGTSLLVSVLLRPHRPHLAAIAVGLSAVDACREVAGLEAGLKWPNDLVVEGRGKLAGILADELGPDGVIVGLGLNVDWGDRPLPPGATSLADLGMPPGADRSHLLVELLVALESRCRQDPLALLDDYRLACSTIGRSVVVNLPGGETVEGTATGVDDDGRLLVGGRAVAAGDVVNVR